MLPPALETQLDAGPTARELPPGLAMGDGPFVLLPTENSGFGQMRAPFPGQEGAESRRRRGKRGGVGGAQGGVMREEAGGGGGAPWGSEGQSAPPLGDPHMALSTGALPGA